jgi:formylglycine-generating enzyme required for sulfatase activity
MKKFIIKIGLLYIVLFLSACVSGGTSAGNTVPLDQAIQAAARNIEDNVQAGQKIAVLNFTSPTEQFSEYVLEELSDALVNGRKLVVVDRRELDLIRQEEQFQLSGEVSDESAQSIGKKLGAQSIVSGSINVIGNVYRFRIRTLAVETAAIETSYSADLSPRETRVTSLLGSSRPATAQTAAVSPDMVRVEGGTFQMGNNDGWDDEKPVHTVTITGFYMGKYEVTQREWTAVMGSNPSVFRGDNLPVETVNWYDAVEYCNRLSEREGLTPAYTIDKDRDDYNNHSFEYDKLRWTVGWNRTANGYRLPTEAEWEYAARGGNGSPGNYIYAGSNNPDEVAWYDGNSPASTQEVGKKKPNGLGLYDMTGNVYEWCWDWYYEEYYSTSPRNDPIGPPWGDSRVARGGSWDLPDSYQVLRTTLRSCGAQNDGVYDQGFRVVRPL